jgi:hypothetical protein
MKIVCIKKYRSTSLMYELTYGKVYDVLTGCGIKGIDDYNCWIINDRGHKEYYFRNIFLTLEKWRDRKLNELLVSVESK